MTLQKIKNNKTCPAKRERSRGFVILFAVTISSIILAIALGVANIALKEIKFSTNARDTNDAFFAADTGVELALFNDKSPNVSCSAPGTCSFVVSGLGSTGQSCAIVTITKTSSPAGTSIISKGYNTGVSLSCASTNMDRVEREINVNY